MLASGAPPCAQNAIPAQPGIAAEAGVAVAGTLVGRIVAGGACTVTAAVIVRSAPSGDGTGNGVAVFAIATGGLVAAGTSVGKLITSGVA
jgi:hypothetical protein